jgi:guanylate kinase
MWNNFVPGLPIVLSGPSGVGKTTIANHLMAQQRVPVVRSISATTREPRSDEIDGEDYFFYAQERFRKEIEEGLFLEWAEVHGHLYGTPLEPLEGALALGKDVLMVIDVQGGRQVCEKLDEVVSIFLWPPSMEELTSRLALRNANSGGDLQTRIDAARREMECVSEYDYVIVNDNIDDTLHQMWAIMVARHCFRERALERWRARGHSITEPIGA